MNLFFILLGKVFPLYINIILGIFSSKVLKVSRDSIATLLIYILGPIVVFNATLSVELNSSILFLPIFFYIFGSIIAFLTLVVFKRMWSDATLNILAFSNGTGNTGYFGIPLAIILFEPELANIYIFTVLASLLYENTTGFYVTAKGSFTASQALKKIARLPIIYAFIAGITLNILGFEIPTILSDYTNGFKHAYGILGMMMIGMGLSGLKNNGSFDLKFIQVSLFVKFIFWPLVIFALIFLDKSMFNFLNEDLYKVMILFAIVPLAGNSVTLAVLLNAKPEKVSLTVFLSTVVSVIFIPLILALYGGF